MQPVDKLVAVNVNIPDAVDVPGLLTGDAGDVGASHPRAMPATAAAFNEMVEVLQRTV